MPARELTTAAPEPSEDDSAIQVVTTLPMRPCRRERRKDGQTDSVSGTERRSRIPRVTRLMALAIKFQDMVTRGEVRDFADIARLGYVTRARLTQIMNLSLLAPNIQEEILGMDGSSHSKSEISERSLRSLAKIDLWRQQTLVWARMKASSVAKKPQR